MDASVSGLTANQVAEVDRMIVEGPRLDVRPLMAAGRVQRPVPARCRAKIGPSGSGDMWSSDDVRRRPTRTVRTA